MWLLARTSSPEEIIATLTAAALELSRARCTPSRPREEGAIIPIASVVDKQLQELKLILIGASEDTRGIFMIVSISVGDAEHDHDEDRGARVAAAAVVQREFSAALVSCLPSLPLESQKNAAHVFANLARRHDGAMFATIIAQDPQILSTLTVAYKSNRPDFALICGMM